VKPVKPVLRLWLVSVGVGLWVGAGGVYVGFVGALAFGLWSFSLLVPLVFAFGLLPLVFGLEKQQQRKLRS